MSPTSKLGCTFCGIVRHGLHANGPTTPMAGSSTSKDPEILWRDDNFTVFRERDNPVSSAGHIIIAFNIHIPNIYQLSSSDLPLLSNLKTLATTHLTALLPPPSTAIPAQQSALRPSFRIGFIGPPFKDPKIPVSDHLHAHAYIEPDDRMSWWRRFAYSSVAWYGIDDLIAEIRECSSNNRVKSGYPSRYDAPIDTVPSAGARTGTASGHENTPAAHGRLDAELESGYYHEILVPARGVDV